MNTIQSGEDLAHSVLVQFESIRNSKRQLVEAKLIEGSNEGCQVLESSDRGICQNPELAVTLLKTVTPANRAKLSSKEEIG